MNLFFYTILQKVNFKNFVSLNKRILLKVDCFAIACNDKKLNKVNKFRDKGI